jgi:nitrate/nitrite transport system permease protein
MSNAMSLPLSAASTSVLTDAKEQKEPKDAKDAKRSAHEMYVETAKQTSAETAEVRAAREAELALKMRRRRERVTSLVQATVPAIVGFALFVLAWQFLSQINNQIPSPAKVWAAAVKLFSDPFYSKGPNDQGIGWNILSSLKRVGIGFGLAALVGIPLGFMIGRFTFLNRMTAPIIAILRPVSPLAWLPIGLLVFKAANPAAIWVIFICSIWPMIINTAVGVQRIPQDYLNVARVLNLSEWKIFTKILFPAVLPYMLTGVKLSIGVAWLVIVAAEMLTGGVGIGFWLWDEWNNLVVEHIIVAIFVIGIVGLLLEQLLTRIASRFEFTEKA